MMDENGRALPSAGTLVYPPLLYPKGPLSVQCSVGLIEHMAVSRDEDCWVGRVHLVDGYWRLRARGPSSPSTGLVLLVRRDEGPQTDGPGQAVRITGHSNGGNAVFGVLTELGVTADGRCGQAG